jgi:hypothetical protein
MDCIWSLAFDNCIHSGPEKYIENEKKTVIKLEFPEENNAEGLEWVKIAMPFDDSMGNSIESRTEMMEAVHNATKGHLDSLAKRNNEGPVKIVSVYVPL